VSIFGRLAKWVETVMKRRRKPLCFAGCEGGSVALRSFEFLNATRDVTAVRSLLCNVSIFRRLTKLDRTSHSSLANKHLTLFALCTTQDEHRDKFDEVYGRLYAQEYVESQETYEKNVLVNLELYDAKEGASLKTSGLMMYRAKGVSRSFRTAEHLYQHKLFSCYSLLLEVVTNLGIRQAGGLGQSG